MGEYQRKNGLVIIFLTFCTWSLFTQRGRSNAPVFAIFLPFRSTFQDEQKYIISGRSVVMKQTFVREPHLIKAGKSGEHPSGITPNNIPHHFIALRCLPRKIGRVEQSYDDPHDDEQWQDVARKWGGSKAESCEEHPD